VYEKVGVKIVPNADAVFSEAEMIVKVKEPQAVEIARLKPHHVLLDAIGALQGRRNSRRRRSLRLLAAATGGGPSNGDRKDDECRGRTHDQAPSRGRVSL
jgi:hypothetical protein